MKKIYYLLITFLIFSTAKSQAIKGVNGWIEQVSGIYTDLNSVYFIDTNIGFAIGSFNTILKTFDGGNTWTSQDTNNYNYDLNSIFFADKKTGFIVGYEHALVIQSFLSGIRESLD